VATDGRYLLTGYRPSAIVVDMKTETITLHDGKVIVYVWTSKRRYVRIDSDSILMGKTNFKRKKKK
jgi:hypothetical protein